MNTNLPDLSLYDAYYVENKPGQSFKLPEDCKGAIGITIDHKVEGAAHSALKLLNHLSLARQDIKMQDDNFGIDLTEVMHAFVVTGKADESCLNVCESVGSGVTDAKIQNGDKDWTSMVIFVPKSATTRAAVLSNALHELKAPESRASYAFIAGFTSLFAQRKLQETHEHVLASEMTDYLKGRGVRDASGDPKEVVCSQLAMRILRAGTLIAALPKEKVQKYELLSDKDLREKLISKLKKTTSSIAPMYQSSEIFKVRADTEALPYELFISMIKNAEVHKPST